MDRLENEFFELISIVDEAKELMHMAVNEIQKMPGELFNISTKILGSIDSYADIKEEYENLAYDIRRVKGQLPKFRRRWNDISNILDELDFKLFLAEAYVFAHEIKSTKSEKKERYNRKWHGKCRNYYKG